MLDIKSAMQSRKVKRTTGQVILFFAAVFMLFLAFIPIILMVVLSLKSNVQIYGNFWTLPSPPVWTNYSTAFFLLYRNMLNSTILVSLATAATVLLASMSGYVFARLKFPGNNVLFMMVLSMMMVPGVLTLTPMYRLVQDLRLYNTWWALFLPWVSGGQVFGILLCRTFISAQPAALFESARIDGSSEFQAYYSIAIPLAKPILATLTVMQLIGYYNDFIWPLMVIDSSRKQMITVAIRAFEAATGAINIGSMVAGYVFTTLPLVVLFLFGSRLYIEGITSGAIKT